MSVPPAHYEELLATYSHHHHAVELLRQYRPYFEKVPSIRRSEESVITIPLPVVQVRQHSTPGSKRSLDCPYELISLPCDLALLMCDPEWQIKTGVEIFVFIHRSHEDFSDLLSRWRETQIALSRGYSWQMPQRYAHIFNEGAEKFYPLFVIFAETPERVRRGLKGAFLPTVKASLFETQQVATLADDVVSDPGVESSSPPPTL
ncbi:hypothetical protein GS597_02340 [Synechococcales cyanobacterium C]|uniref:Uncharacterized protein n=1 Tax=Petrachloros mirabilis ULC683 TaxID=2781853 RepID=A0A8K2AGU0_9CYAN|nr:hypothetical protein [Petrachloros mirabilis]NCJ05370.1 hypothetical protein [Petrachloros mirabilis ULC683]